MIISLSFRYSKLLEIWLLGTVVVSRRRRLMWVFGALVILLVIFVVVIEGWNRGKVYKKNYKNCGYIDDYFKKI